jgi:hypothetical protein
VQITAPVQANLLIIPATALVFQEHRSQVATVKKGEKDKKVVHFKDIEVAQIREGTIEVLHGVTTDDVLIDHPSAALIEGEPVRVVRPAPGYKEGS